MTWPMAVFGCFTVTVLAALAFFITVYFKEYNREEKLFKEVTKAKSKKKMTVDDLPMLYVVAPQKQPVAAKIQPEKNKKDIN